MIWIETQDTATCIEISNVRIIKCNPPKDLKDERPTYQIQTLIFNSSGEATPYLLASYEDLSLASMIFEDLKNSIKIGAKFYSLVMSDG